MTAELDLKVLLKEFGEGDDEHEDLTEVESEGWEQDGKYQSCATVYRHEPTGRFVCINQSRSGSYHSDWYYDDPTICEVVPEVVSITRYVPLPREASQAPAAPGTAPTLAK